MTAPLRKPAERKTVSRCPICGKPTVREHRPFCSKRCAEVDLGRWLKGGYAVPGDPVTKAGNALDRDHGDDELE